MEGSAPSTKEGDGVVTVSSANHRSALRQRIPSSADDAVRVVAAGAPGRRQNSCERGEAQKGRTTSMGEARTRVKALVHVGGTCSKDEGGKWSYQGGEVRLVAVVQGEGALRTILAKAGRDAPIADEDEGVHPGACAVRASLPDRDVWIRLCTDEDLEMLLDEWEQHARTSEGGTAPKLELYVEDDGGGAAHSAGKLESTSLEKNNPLGECMRDEVEHLVHHDYLGTEEGQLDDKKITEPTPPTTPEEGSQNGLHTSMVDVSKSDSQTSCPAVLPTKNVAFWPHAPSLARIPSASLQVRWHPPLGVGAFGRVFYAKWAGSEVAIKQLQAGMFGEENPADSAAIEFLREAEVMAHLRHPNVVTVYGLVQPDDEPTPAISECSELAPVVAIQQKWLPDAPAIVTEFMSGGSLRKALRDKNMLVSGDRRRIALALDAAHGMAFLHGVKIVHFDLKSDNLLLFVEGGRPKCKVCDFGLARQLRNSFVSGVQSIQGTVPWLAPEVVTDPEHLTEKVDVYSFGVVMWELMTGSVPFAGFTDVEVIAGLIRGDAKPWMSKERQENDSNVRDVWKEPCDGWSNLMHECLSGVPDLRPSFSDIAEALEAMYKIANAKR